MGQRPRSVIGKDVCKAIGVVQEMEHIIATLEKCIAKSATVNLE